MVFQSYDISSIVSIAKDLGVACAVVIIAPFVYLSVLGSSIGEDYLPSNESILLVLFVIYALLSVVTWHGWRRLGIDQITSLAIAVFWVINASLFCIYWITENYQYAAIFGLFVGAVSVPLLDALVRALLSSNRNRGLQLSLRSFLSQRRFRKRPPRRATGWCSFWHYLEFTVILFAAVYWTFIVGRYIDSSWFLKRNFMSGTIQYGLAIPLFVYAFKRKRLAEQLRALSIEDATDSDRRSPILFLRSFADDELCVRKSTGLLAIRMPLESPAIDPKFWGKLVRIEEVIANTLWEIAPVVAIGAPDEEMPQLGAIRSYYSDTSWQASVTALMRRARLVFVILSGSKSVQWEMEALRQLGLMSKVVFLVPPGAVTTQIERWKSLDIDGDIEPIQKYDPTVRAMVVRDNMWVALTSSELNELDLALIIRGAVDLSLKSNCA